MTIPVQAFYYILGAIVAVGLLTLFARGDKRRYLANLLLVLLTVFSGGFMFNAASQRMGKSNSTVVADQAEMQLRVISMAQAVSSRAFGKGDTATATAVPAVLSASDIAAENKAFASAADSLRKAAKQNANAPLFKAKLAVVLGAHNLKEHKEEIDALASDLLAYSGTPEVTESLHKFGALAKQAYVEEKLPATQVESDAQLVKTVFTSGWYRDHALRQVYSAAGEEARLKTQVQKSDDRAMITFLKLLGILVVVVVCGLTGIVAIVLQWAVASPNRAEFPDEVGLDIPLKTVYAVFVSWFSLEILVSFAYHYLEAKLPSLGVHALPTAITTGVTYLISNISAPLLIWWLAFKPRGLEFWNSLRLTRRTSTSGPVKLFALGFVGWCSAIPIVAGTALIASQLLHVTGSDNPVLGQILEAANAASLPATMMFYFTLGVMAPFFEEMLFRGFIFAALKTRIGSFWAIMASSALFALMHFDKGGALMLFAIGFVLAYLFNRTRSLLPSMICHGLWNSGTFTFALLLFGS